MRTQFANFEKLSAGRSRLAGRDAWQIVFTGERAGRMLKVRRVLLSKGRLAYLLSCEAAPEDFAEAQAGFDSILDSFELIGPRQPSAAFPRSRLQPAPAAN